jgi:hypothetical protein
MTLQEQAELEALREFKRKYELSPLDVAFNRLEGLLDRPYAKGFDGVMSVVAFRTVAECLILLKERIK